jgi:hypothetical protein
VVVSEYSHAQSLVDDLYDHIAISVDMSSAWPLPDEDQHQQHSGLKAMARRP